MKLVTPSLIALALTVNVSMAAYTSYGGHNQYADKDNIVCDSPTSHCVYLENAKSYGAAEGTWVRCASVDEDGFGYGVCEFPQYASVTISCTEDQNSGLTIAFDSGDLGSQYSTFGNDIHAIWSSEKGKSKRIDGYNTFSKENGDDLHVSCPKYSYA